MRNLFAVFSFIIGMIAVGFWCNPHKSLPVNSTPCRRIVSLAPGITETLYAIGLGEDIAGVTQFCTYPPDTANKPMVAGFRDINLEAIARTKADLVILPDDMAHYRQQIENLGIKVMLFNCRTLTGYLQDVQNLGKWCGTEKAADELVAVFHTYMSQNKNYKKDQKPGVLFALINPDECLKPISDLTILGKDGFYDELVMLAGGHNAYLGNVPYPRISKEAIFTINPDIIVAAAHVCRDVNQLERNWQNLDPARASRNDNLLLLTEDGDTIPGPRSLNTLKKLREIIDRWHKNNMAGEGK